MTLTVTERWILSNQCLILAKLYPEEEKHYDDIREALDSGYERHYAPEHITKNEDAIMSEDECQEVLDILNMFRSLTFDFKHLTDRDGIDESRLAFDGFDGNEETKHMTYVRYYCSLEGGRFTDVVRVHDVNSHARRLPHYRAMLAEFRRIKARKPSDVLHEAPFTAGEIRAVLTAR
jgi:hypothetical protein